MEVLLYIAFLTISKSKYRIYNFLKLKGTSGYIKLAPSIVLLATRTKGAVKKVQ